MSTDRWKRVNDVFLAALELDPARRSQFLRMQCGDDPQVMEEVASLLEAHDNAGNFIEHPIATPILDGIQADDELLAPGESIGVYKIVKEIGRGGMGAVYLAARADHAYEKHVAIKLLKRGMDTAEVLRHFRNERQILAAFDHPHIARLLDGGTTESGLPYFVMEYVQGMPIDEYCDQQRLTIVQRLELFRQVCSAISYAHRHLVIHRDIKPSNIVVTAEGVPKLLDFGIAKILHADSQSDSTATGIRMMTPEYASPEQAMGLPVTTVSDVYSLGVVLYELLTGHSPFHFQSRSPIEIARVIHETHPLLPSASIDPGNDESVSSARNTSIDQLQRRLRGDLDTIVLMALRKEAERRYQSVEQFSEDIRRHLTGLPVFARKDTIVYRMTKFARRNRVPVAAGLLVLLSLIAGFVATTWQAQKAKTEQARAEYAREFADEVRYIETLMLSTYTAPLHDVRHSMNLARARLKQIEQRMLQAGQSAYGSGHHALGNGYLVLKDYERARVHLEKSWNAGYQGPSTAYALGKVLGILYLQTLRNADQLTSAEMKRQLIGEARIQYAQPAIRYLAFARTNAESPAYVEGLIALYEKRFPEALAKAAEARRFSSRPDEVAKLEGDIHFEMGRQAAAKGDYPAAFKSYDLAGIAYRAAAQIARSDADIYLADAQRVIRTINSDKQEPAKSVQEGLELCDKATRINPDDDRPFIYRSNVHFQQGVTELYYTSKDARLPFRMAVDSANEAIKRKESADGYQCLSQAYLRIGEYETINSVDPRDTLKRAIEASQNAIRVDPYHTDSYLDLASAHFYLGEYELTHGGDPTRSHEKVIDIYNKDLHSLKKDEYSYNLLGLSYLGLGEYKLKRGLDPRGDFQKAIFNGRLGLKINTNAATLRTNMGLAFAGMAKYEMNHGIDPGKSFDETIRQYQKASEMNPDAPIPIFNRGLIHVSRAEYKLRIGEDPQPDIKLAMESFQSAMKLLGDLPIGSLQIGSAHLLQGRHQFAIGKDPGSELMRARQMLQKYLMKDQSSPEAYLIQGRIEILAARWAMKNHQLPDKFFDRAIAELEKCIELDQHEIAAFLELASLYRWRAEWSMKPGKLPEKWIDLGLQKTAEAEKITPLHPELLAIRGTLLRLKGQTRQDPALEQQATDLLQRALQNNRFLIREYGN